MHVVHGVDDQQIHLICKFILELVLPRHYHSDAWSAADMQPVLLML